MFQNARFKCRPIFIFAFFIILSVLQIQAQVVANNSSTAGSFNATGLSTLSWSQTIGTGNNRALYVGVSTSTSNLPIGFPTARVASVTFDNGIETRSLDRVGTVISSYSKNTVELFRLVNELNPPTGSGTITVTFATVPDLGNAFVNYAVGGSISFTGVSQTTPNGALAAPNTGANSTPSIIVSDEVSGDLVFSVLGASVNAGFMGFDPVATGQTLYWDGPFASFDIGAGCTKPGSSNSPVSIDWTITNPDNWALGAITIKQFVSTAATVSMSGRVTLPSGKGISRARVTLTDSNGETHSALTNFFGYFSFTDVRAGGTYIFNIVSKQYSFSPQVITVNEETSDLNFVAEQ